MARTTSHDCPNCGAPVRDDGRRDVVPCLYCGTKVSIERRRGGGGLRISIGDMAVELEQDQTPYRIRALERERSQLLVHLNARKAQWNAEIARLRDKGNRFAFRAGCYTFIAVFIVTMIVVLAAGITDSDFAGGIAVWTAMGLSFFVWMFAKALRGNKPTPESEAMVIQRDADLRDEMERLVAIDAELDQIRGR